MAIPFSCRECGQLYQVDDSLAGKRAKCKKCQAVMEVPGRPKPVLQTFGAPEARPAAARRPADEDVPSFNAYDDMGGDPYEVAPMPPARGRALDDEIAGPRRPGASKGGGKKARMATATIWQRFCASLVDGIVQGFINIALGMLVAGAIIGAGVNPATAGPQLFLNLIGLAIWFFYNPWRVASEREATPGKAYMSLRVVDMQGRRLSLGRAIGREVAKALEGLTLGIGLLVAFFNPERRTLHDYVAGTRVVRD